MKIHENSKIDGIVEVYIRERKNGKWEEWRLNERKHNLIVNSGYNSLIAGVFGISGYTSVVFDSFGVSNGTVDPVVTRVATDFDADGTTFRKAVYSSAWDSTSKTATIVCYLTSTDNTVTSITKFALFDQTTAGGTMWNEVEFSTAKTKNSDIEIYFTYYLTLTQV